MCGADGDGGVAIGGGFHARGGSLCLRDGRERGVGRCGG